MDLELAISSNFANFAGIGILFLQWRLILLRRRDFTVMECLYFRILSFLLWGYVYELMHVLDQRYAHEDARKALL